MNHGALIVATLMSFGGFIVQALKRGSWSSSLKEIWSGIAKLLKNRVVGEVKLYH